jgi:hypothetical protein
MGDVDQSSFTREVPDEYTNGTDFRPAKRLPVEHIVYFDTW